MNIALIAHDKKKELMVQFCIAYKGILAKHMLCATGTTGGLVSDATGLSVHRFLSGPQGGDQQIGARIAYNEIDLVLFFRDPLTAQTSRAGCFGFIKALRRAQRAAGYQCCHSGGFGAGVRTRRFRLARHCKS